MLWYGLGPHLFSLAALLVIVSCGGGEQRRGTDSSSSSSSSSTSSTGGSSSSGGSSSRRFHKIQHGQCTYTFILPEGEGGRGGACREAKAGGPQHKGNSLQRDAPPPEPEFASQKIQQLEHIMENYTQWLQKVRRGGGFKRSCKLSRPTGSFYKKRRNAKQLLGSVSLEVVTP